MLIRYCNFFFFALLIFSCGPTFDEEAKEPALDWIIGSWEREDEAEGKRTTENWTKKSDGVYVGDACTLLDVDTVFAETMVIHKLDSTWVLEVSGPNEQPTIFRFSEYGNSGFISTCPENEFPKNIAYEKDGEKLKAYISDGITEIEFKFRRINHINHRL